MRDIFDRDGITRVLTRWMLTLTPAERLDALENGLLAGQRHSSDPDADATIVSYGADGLEWCRRLPGHGDAHFLAEHQGKF